MDGLLSLKWNNHSSTFFYVLETIRKKGLYSDVTIACDGKYFDAHKLVLSTCSDYFQEMFEKTQCKHPIIVLKDINSKDLEFLLNYMYVGEVNVLQNELSSLIKAAECLRVKGLAVPDEPPPSKKSNKRHSDKEENLASKRSRKSASSRSSDVVERRSPITTDLSIDDSRQKENLFPERSESQKELAGIESVMIKTENQDPPDDYEQSDENSLVKIESFEQEEPLHQDVTSNNIQDDVSVISSQRHQQEMGFDDGSGPSFPSTSNFEDPSNWSGDIETVDDDEEMGGIDLGDYDPSAFPEDPSQAKGPVELRSFICRSMVLPSLTSSYMKRENNWWFCTQCGYNSYYKTDVSKHIRKHTGEKPYKCPFCDLKFASTSPLYKHIRFRHPNYSKA